MINGNGTLKLSDFGFAKVEGEDLEAIFQETWESTSSQWNNSTPSKPAKVYKKPFGDLRYMAPEIYLGKENSKESDLWSLGCMLYRMYTGSIPFSADNEANLRSQIIGKECPNPRGNKLSTKASSEFLDLLKGLMQKDPTKRQNKLSCSLVACACLFSYLP
jgi:serine/threonine-protein kinase ULK4